MTDDDQQMQQAMDDERRRAEEEIEARWQRHIDAVWPSYKAQHQPPVFGLPGHREPWDKGTDYRLSGRNLYYGNELVHTFEKGEKIK